MTAKMKKSGVLNDGIWVRCGSFFLRSRVSAIWNIQHVLMHSLPVSWGRLF